MKEKKVKRRICNASEHTISDLMNFSIIDGADQSEIFEIVSAVNNKFEVYDSKHNYRINMGRALSIGLAMEYGVAYHSSRSEFRRIEDRDFLKRLSELDEEYRSLIRDIYPEFS